VPPRLSVVLTVERWHASLVCLDWEWSRALDIQSSSSLARGLVLRHISRKRLYVRYVSSVSPLWLTHVRTLSLFSSSFSSQIKAVFQGLGKVTDVRPDIGDTWFVTMEDEATATDALLKLRLSGMFYISLLRIRRVLTRASLMMMS